MAQFASFADDVDVASQALNAFIDGFPRAFREQGIRILKNHGLDQVKDSSFYSLGAFLKAMKDIQDTMVPDILYSIGKRIANNAILPPGIDSIDSAFQSIDVAYPVNHRGCEIGCYKYTSLGNDGVMERGIFECCNPCAFDRGA